MVACAQVMDILVETLNSIIGVTTQDFIIFEFMSLNHLINNI
jgi:hypothetical protein